MGRTIVNQLHKEAPLLKTFLSKMRVRSRADSHYERYQQELQGMCEQLDSFIMRSSDAIAVAESVSATDIDAIQASKSTLEGLFGAAELHLGGCKQVQKRYATY